MASDLTPGTVFADRYRVERRIAAGGMGAVYQVTHLETGRRRALKVLHANLVQSEELRARFRQEARVAAKIESEYIVDVFDAGIDVATEMPFLVMELLRGEDVRQRIRRCGPIPYDETIRILMETAFALDKTHQARIVHRDLKPDNLFLCEREHGPARVKVLDFGIAKLVEDSSMHGQTKESLGTPLYMAPEQFLLANTISPATDVFALGLIAYTMLVGKPYWQQEATLGAAVAFALHASKGPQESAVARAARHGITLPPAFDGWFFRTSSPRIEDRYQVATDTIINLAHVLGVPLSMAGSSSDISVPSGIGRTTLGAGANVNANFAGLGVNGPVGDSNPQLVSPGMPPPHRASLPSIPGTHLAESGSSHVYAHTVARRTKTRNAAIAATAALTILAGGVIYVLALTTPTSQTALPTAPTPSIGANPSVAESHEVPTATPVATVVPSTSALPMPVAPNTSSTATPTQPKNAGPLKARPSASASSKGNESKLWGRF